MTTQTRVRKAAKAGSWYKSDRKELSQQFDYWLQKATKSINNDVKSIICPHAGYYYCGSTGAYSYKHINTDKISRIFILGPDHRGSTYEKKCLLSGATHWETPFGHIKVDTKAVNEIYQSNKKLYGVMSLETDMDEHSLELCVPFLTYRYYTSKRDISAISIVPIIVGGLKDSIIQDYAESLYKYFDDPSTLFIISSDFCHWGNNYQYQPLPSQNSGIKIYDFISKLDHQGMELIEQLNYKLFRKYLDETNNTICGRNPIMLLLNVVKYSTLNKSLNLKFLHYSQSDKVETLKDYSVSYASGVLYLNENKSSYNKNNNNNNSNNNNNNKD